LRFYLINKELYYKYLCEELLLQAKI